MSLGGGAHGIQDLLTIAVDNLDTGNMVVAVAAGNSGPGHFTVESPGSAARALSAGASSVGHFVAAPITVGGSTYAGVTGDFPVVTGPGSLTRPLAVVTSAPVNAVSGLSEACSALPAGSLTGKIALIGARHLRLQHEDPLRPARRRDARSSSATASRATRRPWARASRPDGVQPTVPAYMVSLTDALALKTEERAVDHHQPEPGVLRLEQRLHPGRLQRPGADRRRLPGQAGRHGAGRQRPELRPG